MIYLFSLSFYQIEFIYDDMYFCFLICKIQGCSHRSLPTLTFCDSNVCSPQKYHNSAQDQPKTGWAWGGWAFVSFETVLAIHLPICLEK